MGWDLLIYAVVMMVISYAITALMMPKPVEPKPASLEDFQVPQADERTPQAVVFGDVWVPDWMVLWYGDFRSVRLR